MFVELFLGKTSCFHNPGRIDKIETATPGRGFVRVITDSVRTMDQYGGVSIEIGESLATCTAMDHAWIITSMMCLKSGWPGVPEELIRKVKMDCDRQVVLESGGYRSATWCTLRTLQQVHGAQAIWGCTCVTSPPSFRQIGSSEGRDDVKILGALEATIYITLFQFCIHTHKINSLVYIFCIS